MSYRRAAMVALLAISSVAQGQSSQPPARGWEYVWLPALNFNTDEGFGYGVLLEAYNYGAGVRPYRFSVQPTVFLTTKGRRDATIFFDAPALLANGLRIDGFVGREQELAAPYYGVGNGAAYDEHLVNDPNPYFYRYGRTRVRLTANVQRPVGRSSLRLLLGGGYADVRTDATPFDSGTTLFAQDLGAAPAPKGAISFLRGGVVWDSRDREIGAHSGWWNEVLVQRVDDALGASHDYTRITATVRRYSPITPRLTSAARLILQQTEGDVPIYDLATVQSSYKQDEGLGGAKMLRGIPKNRVMGKGLMLMNHELRWRAKEFQLRGKPSFLLLSGFTDVGRVWDESIRVEELVSDLWFGYGGGIRLGLGSSSVIALDVGRSAQVTQLYIGLGYAY